MILSGSIKLLIRSGQNGIYVSCDTDDCPVAAWLSTRYPEVLPVDIQGRKRTHGMRVFFCVNSLKYRERVQLSAEDQSAMRIIQPLPCGMYQTSMGLTAIAQPARQSFVCINRKRYGSVQELNNCWHTTFWGRISQALRR